MKLRNKQTPNKFGEIVAYDVGKGSGIAVKTDQGVVWYYHSLAELNEEWGDYEEPKVYYYIDDTGVIQIDQLLASEINMRKSIGNYFNTREEAVKAVEKLKAWKRLKDAGFGFSGWTHTPITKSLTGYNLHIKAYSDKLADYMDDLDLLTIWMT